MFFRNLTLFRFAPSVASDLERLDGALDQHRLRPCGPLETSTHGAVPPLGGGEDEPLVHTVDDYALACVGSEDKLLPASVVNQELARKVRKVAADEGRTVGARERRRIKAELLEQLLPRAFARPSRLNLYADRKHGWLVLDTASRKAAENAITRVREALGNFPATPLAPERAPRQLLTDWLAGGDLPAELSLTEECELRDPSGAAGATVRCRHQPLASDEVQAHLRSGKQVYQLGLAWGDRFEFVLGEDLVLRKLRFFDTVTDELDDGEPDSATAELETRFALMAMEVAPLLAKLETWFGLPRPANG